ncbi:hypothetical protein PUNSTDRAFT_84630, partial [Punctularia strigosozonata HHB-11173 SS5]|uniref:uncharacterized protein n=1 Tax=Punctularia strigosozonata (strain HHB-11173) TaxID=741275 RepID=UPI00044183CE
MEETFSKRLHVSGLTPAIKPSDLQDRFGKFGTVKALDGFGLLDGLGQPRRFGYITLEATKAQLSRCLTLMSGVTWKGAKLRVGEAKPDFQERHGIFAASSETYIPSSRIYCFRLEKERATEDGDDVRPKKRRRLARGVQGVHAENMDPVTPENVKARPGWRVTVSGRLVRPIRIRSARPLPEPLSAKIATAKSGSSKGKEVKKKKRIKPPPVRARRRTIDPTRWGSEHLKGAFLGEETTLPSPPASTSSEDIVIGSAEEDDEGAETEPDEEEPQQTVAVANEKAEKPSADASTHTTHAAPAIGNAIQEEKRATLSLLRSMFDETEDDWGGAEDVESNVDVGEGEYDEDSVPAQPMVVDRPDVTTGAISSTVEDVAPPVGVEPEKSERQAPVQRPNLKELFAPREEDGRLLSHRGQTRTRRLSRWNHFTAGFSLLDQLDIDLEMDPDVDFGATSREHDRGSPVPSSARENVADVPSADVRPRNDGVFVPDPKEPLFFPAPESVRRGRGGVKDMSDVAREGGWDWRTAFYRTETDEELRQQWEEQKGELTRTWKRRHREALKSRRRRGGGEE